MKRILWLTMAVSAAMLLHGCKDSVLDEPDMKSDGTVTFIIGNDTIATKSPEQVATYDLEQDGLSIIETVSDMDGSDPLTKGTPVYTENFDSLYGEQLYATAFEPKAGNRSLMTDVWGSYLENDGTVKFKLTEPHRYSYHYSLGQSVNLAWPDGGSLLYFLQAPYSVTSKLSPKFYSDGSIEFDYTDPTAPKAVGGRQTIVNGAKAHKDVLFSSKTVESGSNNILMYHALTAVKFKVGNVDPQIGQNSNSTVTTKITKVTFKGIKANGHCTISPNYTDSNTAAGSNPSNAGGAASTKSSACSIWGAHSKDGNLVVDYSQEFSGTVDYTSGEEGNSNFGGSFYDGSTNVRNLVNADGGGEVMLMVPQTLSNVEVVVDFTIDDVPFSRSVKMSGTWKAGELHTYTLTVNKVSVTVDDSMDVSKAVKDNVTTANNGNVTAYLRAQVATAWYYGYGDDAIVVAAYLNNGWFYNGDDRYRSPYSKHWIKGDDGYYYYKYPVLPGRSTTYKLFGRYEAPQISEKAPFPGAHLEMKIILQGVQFDAEKTKVDAAWGEVLMVDESGTPTGSTVVSQLTTIPEGTTN